VGAIYAHSQGSQFFMGFLEHIQKIRRLGRLRCLSSAKARFQSPSGQKGTHQVLTQIIVKYSCNFMRPICHFASS
jgi:hypothetical protein